MCVGSHSLHASLVTDRLHIHRRCYNVLHMNALHRRVRSSRYGMEWCEEAEVPYCSSLPLGGYVRILVPVDTALDGQSTVQEISQRINDRQPGAQGSACWPVNSDACHLVCHKVCSPYSPPVGTFNARCIFQLMHVSDCSDLHHCQLKSFR